MWRSFFFNTNWTAMVIQRLGEKTAVYCLCYSESPHLGIRMKRQYTAFFFPIANLTENWQCTVFALNSPNRWESKCRDGTLPFFFQQQTLVSYVAKQNSDVYDTGSSQAVPHPSTIPARQCLTSVIERERVFHCGMTVDKCLMNVC